VFDLKGEPVREQEELKIFVKDWERVGRNRSLQILVMLAVRRD